MRERMERLVMLPFSVGCVSESSVGVAAVPGSSRRQPTCTNMPNNSESAADHVIRERSPGAYHLQLDSQHPHQHLPGMKHSLDHISSGIHRLFKTISYIFAYKEEGADDDQEDMEIGFPTDVKHVTHIGPADGSASSSSSSSSSTTFSWIHNINGTTPVPAGCNMMEMDYSNGPNLNLVRPQVSSSDQYPHHLICLQAPGASTATSSSHLVKPASAY